MLMNKTCLIRKDERDFRGKNLKTLSVLKMHLVQLVGAGLSRVCCLVIQGSTGGFFLFR